MASRTNPFVVGGFVRDWVSGGPFESIDDFDCMTDLGNGDKLAQAFAEASGYENELTTYEYSGTMLVYHNNLKFEFQSDNNPHVHFNVASELNRLGVVATTLTKNIYERDFTINTLCYDVLRNKIVDVTGYGVQDLYHDSILRTPIAAKQAMINNPFLLLRMVRFQIQLNLTLDKELAMAVPEGVEILKSRYQDRTQKFVDKLVRKTFGLNPDLADKLYRDYGLYDVVKSNAIPKRYKEKALFDGLEKDYQSSHNNQRKTELF